MGRPRKDPNAPSEPYATKTRGWLVCAACDRSIPYAGKADPTEGEGWPQHRCEANRSKATAFSYHTTTDPNPPITRDWDSFDTPKPEPEVMIG